MTATVAPPLPTTEELVTTALARLEDLAKRVAGSRALCRNEAERHANIDDVMAIYAALLTPPLRPGQVT